MSGWEEVFFGAFAPTLPGLSVDVAMTTSTGEGIRLRVRAGELQKVALDEKTAPDLVLRFETGTLTSVLFGTATCDIFRDAEVLVNGSWRAALPYAERELPRTGRFEFIPGASFAVAVHLTSTIFGEVGICERWEDGALVSSELVPALQLDRVQADVRLWCTLGQLAAIRRRLLTPLDALAQGVGVFGDWPLLMCFAELIQHPAYLRAWNEQPTLDAQLGWGEVVSSPAYGTAVNRVREYLASVVGT